MNMDKRYDGYGSTVTEYLTLVPGNMRDDLWGIWGIISAGKAAYEFAGQDLREFIYLNVKVLIEAGGVPIESAKSPWRYYEHATRYGKTPEEIARNVVAEWVEQGEPEIHGYEGIAFAMPEYLESEDNRRETPRVD